MAARPPSGARGPAAPAPAGPGIAAGLGRAGFGRAGFGRAGLGRAGPQRLGARARIGEHEGAGVSLSAALSAGRAGIGRSWSRFTGRSSAARLAIQAPVHFPQETAGAQGSH